MSVRAKERRDLGFACFTLGDGAGELVEAAFGRLDLHPIEIEKDECCHCPGPLVAIDERMVLHQVVQVGGCHLKHVFAQVLAAERCTRLRNRGLQQSHIAHTMIAAVAVDLVRVQREHVFGAEEMRHRDLLCQSLQVVAELAVDLLQRRAELRLALLVTNGRDQDRVAVCRHLQRRIGRNLEHFEDGLVDYQGQAVAVSDQGLAHVGSSLWDTHSIHRHAVPGKLGIGMVKPQPAETAL